ncbi:hypothetical protein BE21_30845 [Sorangium cellulosum]|uniref:Uncharacterized protein n=1 Tax=Sorangium cellulosum TaxID=56 RepID=A0A150TR18_SORCE|nr:hypothetical protein BE21_30845 [Sorangium cellulosum]
MRFVAQSLWICTMLGVATGITPPVCAQSRNPAPVRSDVSPVKEHLRRARSARAKGRWTEAYAAYKAAFEATDSTSDTERESAEIAGELGLCELALRKYRDAAEHLAWSLERRKALSLAQQKLYGDGLATAARFVATLYLSVDPPDAEVLVDGKQIGPPRRTYTLFFEPGKHMVRARAPGREEAFQSLDARAATELTMTIQLPRAAVSSSGEGAPAGPTKKAATEAHAATNSARVPAPSASWPGTLRIGGVALTTATAAAGALFLLRAHVLHRNLREANSVRREQGWTPHTCREASAPAACAGIQDQVKERDLFATLGKVSLATSAVFGVATAASFFTEVAVFGEAPKAAGIHVAPMATSERAGVLLEGAW